jgi:hypothetical protein
LWFCDRSEIELKSKKVSAFFLPVAWSHPTLAG